MTEDFTYDVICKECYKKFQVEMFGTESRNIYLANNKDWYCEDCKKKYVKEKTRELTEAQKSTGFPELTGTAKQVSWAVKIRAELVNKVEYLQQSLSFESDQAKEASENAFGLFFKEWQEITTAKWWIDNRKITVRDISTRIAEISKEICS